MNVATSPADFVPGPLTLWYDRPASEWVEALPLGNGRLGAMVHGRTDEEVISLNDNTLYSGEPSSRDLPLNITRDFDRITNLLQNGRYAEADDDVTKHWLGRGQNSYQPLGELRLSFAEKSAVVDYRRTLNLSEAVATNAYTQHGVRYTRECFASRPDGALTLRLRTSRPGALHFSIQLASPHPAAIHAADGTLSMTGRVPFLVVRRTLEWIEARGEQWKYPELFEPDGKRRAPRAPGGGVPQATPVLYSEGPTGAGTRFASCLRVRTADGIVRVNGNAIVVDGATDVVLLLTVGSSYNGFDKSPSRNGVDAEQQALSALAAIADTPFDTLRSRHVDDYRELFDRVSIELGSPSDPSRQPTDRRLASYAAGGDEGLAALYFQFGRYLMIAGSRPGGQPLNLQGLWNDIIVPPWASAYTTNINIEMNYWPAEVLNLAECHEPLLRFIEQVAVSGRRVARETYGRPGWVAHHNTDLWRDAQPVDNIARTSWWPMAGGWLCQHLWLQYKFARNRHFLSERAYPLMKGAAEFYLSWLVDDGNGCWVTPVGTSPENGFLYVDAEGRKQTSSVCAGPTMDLAIVRDLLTNCIAASRELDIDTEFRAQAQSVLDRLLPYRIGSRGQVQEWPTDFEDEEPHHRHVSHLFGLHPGDQITQHGTPELFAAARRTLELRGDGGTGWSLAWKINFWARLQDGEHAHNLLRMLLIPARTYPNLFDAHPPFQIDGNFGAVAGVAEMLLQSQGGALHLLPALPSTWPDGRVTGLRARDGFTVDLTWQAGHLVQATVHAMREGPCFVRYANRTCTLDARAGQTFVFGRDL